MMNINKKKLRKVICVYTALMLVLIFFSKTFYNISLPRVSAAMPEGGSLTKTLTARGTIGFSETFAVFANADGVIGELRVKEGDAVTEDTLIAAFKTDTPEALERAAEQGFAVERLENRLAALELNRAAVADRLDAAREYADGGAADGSSSDVMYDGALRGYTGAVADTRAALEARRAELARESELTAFDDHVYAQAIEDAARALDRAKAEFEIGASPRAAVDDAEHLYDGAVAERDHAAAVWELEARDRRADAQSGVADAERALERAEDDLEAARRTLAAENDALIKSLELELRGVDLEIAAAGIELRAANTSGATRSAAGVTAGCRGVVVSLEKEMGETVSRGERLATVAAENGGYVCELSCPEPDGRFITVGDTARVSAGGGTQPFDAAVTDIAAAVGALSIKLACETAEPGLFRGGEYVAVDFEKQTDRYELLVPSEAVIHEGFGYCVWVVRGGEWTFGPEYRAVKLRVTVADTDGYYTAISRGINFPEPVITSFDKSLTPNGRVSRLE